MSYNLSKYSKIQEDYEKFKLAVNRIQNLHIKKQYEIFLNDFKKQISLIEEGHSSYNNGYIDPKNNKENIIRLVELRQKLEKLL